MAAACILQRTGKETLVRGDLSPYVFLKSHWSCPSEFKLSCSNPEQQTEVLVFKDSRKESIPTMSEAKESEPQAKRESTQHLPLRVHEHTQPTPKTGTLGAHLPYACTGPAL